MALPLNTILQGRYRIVRQLGQGGMGTVYEAIDGRLNSLVAIKESRVESEEGRRAFEREASLLANLRHASLPKVIDHFVEDGGQFLVMEFIQGTDLAKLLALRESAFPPEQVIRWSETILNVLDYLHKRNPPILHRDIKPANLKLDEDGELFLLDFGLAKGAMGQMPTLVTSRSFLGYTRFYAPLEQVHGSGTDPRSDIYSLGATLYHLITGIIPADAPTRYDAIEEGKADPLRPASEVNPEVTEEIGEVLSRAMAMSRRDRFASAVEMRKALQKAKPVLPSITEVATRDFQTLTPLTDERPLIVPPPIAEKVKVKTNSRYFAVSAIALLLFAAIGVGYWFSSETSVTPIPFRKGDKFGYSDANKNLLTEAKYEAAEPFNDGLARVKLNGKYGFINKQGKEVIPLKYDFAQYGVPFTSKDKNSNDETLLAVELNGKWGYINKTGKEIIPLIYDDTENVKNHLEEIFGRLWILFKDGGEYGERLLKVKLNDKWGFIAKTGKEVIPFKYDSSHSFSEGLAPVQLNKKWGFINKAGEEIIPFKYDEAYPFTDGLAGVRVNGKLGFIDGSGNEVIPLKYEEGKPFFEELAAVKLNGKFGFIDKRGKEVIPYKYDEVGMFGFNDGLASVRLNGKWGFIDKADRLVIPFKFESQSILDFGSMFTDGLAFVKLNNNGWGFIDKTGEGVIPFKYNNALPFIEGLAKVTLNGKEFYIDKNGTEYYEP